jgi:hypothetical protein
MVTAGGFRDFNAHLTARERAIKLGSTEASRHLERLASMPK